jgi:hypothetical protein
MAASCQNWSPTDPERGRRWYEILERTGPDNVRARLAQVFAGSAGSISIGTETNVTSRYWSMRRVAPLRLGFLNLRLDFLGFLG